ncbi:MAG: dehydrogenase, partial [Flavobacteriaceae bacterium]|nr:dehydrogenase [Flavobacteriaceae bacterium]
MKNKSNSNKSRRSFIKKTSIATGAIVASPLFVEAMSNVHAEKKLKVALVGCGGRGSGAAIQALKADENVELVAMADVFKDRLESSLKNINEYFEGARRIK